MQRYIVLNFDEAGHRPGTDYVSIMPSRLGKSNGLSTWVLRQSKKQHRCYCQTAYSLVVDEHSGKIL